MKLFSVLVGFWAAAVAQSTDTTLASCNPVLVQKAGWGGYYCGPGKIAHELGEANNPAINCIKLALATPGCGESVEWNNATFACKCCKAGVDHPYTAWIQGWHNYHDWRDNVEYFVTCTNSPKWKAVLTGLKSVLPSCWWLGAVTVSICTCWQVIVLVITFCGNHDCPDYVHPLGLKRALAGWIVLMTGMGLYSTRKRCYYSTWSAGACIEDEGAFFNWGMIVGGFLTVSGSLQGFGNLVRARYNAATTYEEDQYRYAAVLHELQITTRVTLICGGFGAMCVGLFSTTSHVTRKRCKYCLVLMESPTLHGAFAMVLFNGPAIIALVSGVLVCCRHTVFRELAPLRMTILLILYTVTVFAANNDQNPVNTGDWFEQLVNSYADNMNMDGWVHERFQRLVNRVVTCLLAPLMLVVWCMLRELRVQLGSLCQRRAIGTAVESPTCTEHREPLLVRADVEASTATKEKTEAIVAFTTKHVLLFCLCVIVEVSVAVNFQGFLASMMQSTCSLCEWQDEERRNGRSGTKEQPQIFAPKFALGWIYEAAVGALTLSILGPRLLCELRPKGWWVGSFFGGFTFAMIFYISSSFDTAHIGFGSDWILFGPPIVHNNETFCLDPTVTGIAVDEGLLHPRPPLTWDSESSCSKQCKTRP